MLEDLRDRTALHDAASVHYRNTIAHPGHHPEVVGDEQDRHPCLGLEALQQL